MYEQCMVKNRLYFLYRSNLTKSAFYVFNAVITYLIKRSTLCKAAELSVDSALVFDTYCITMAVNERIGVRTKFLGPVEVKYAGSGFHCSDIYL